MKQPGLAQAIQSLYPEPLNDAEAQEAARNLAAFFELLIEIDSGLQAVPGITDGAPPCA